MSLHQLPEVDEVVLDTVYGRCRQDIEEAEKILLVMRTEQPLLHEQLVWFQSQTLDQPLLYTVCSMTAAMFFGALHEQAVKNGTALPEVSQTTMDKHSDGMMNAVALGTLDMRTRADQLKIENQQLHGLLLILVQHMDAAARPGIIFAVEMVYGLLSSQLVVETPAN